MATRREGKIVSVVAVGDVHIQREDPTSAFVGEVRGVLNKADIAFCNLEGPISDKGDPTGKLVPCSEPRMVAGLTTGGFGVVSLANNHMDFGPEATLRCIDILDRNGIAHVGAGANLLDARKPVILERNDTRVAFLAYCSFFTSLPSFLIATSTRAGIAPVRTSPLYEPPHVERHDLEAMREDIKLAKAQADVVLVSHHWGVSMARTLTPHQRAIGHATIDAGADLVLGGHPHILQGIEIYKGKVICYSLGNFLFDVNLPFIEGEKTMVVKCLLSPGGIESVSFLPALGSQFGQPRLLGTKENEAGEIFGLMAKLCGELGTTFSVEDGEAVLSLKTSG
jgi:poly-gamma-glutamate synthesis protein (capsule biosynthesis protein)